MSKQHKKDHQEDSFENVENALSRSEQFIEENQNIISIVTLALIVVVGGYWAMKKLYLQPLNEEAQKSIYAAQQHFAKDSFNLALNGDGNSIGFLDAIDEYGSTKAGNLANYYAGVSYLHLGQFEKAIDYLESFSCDDDIISATANGALGDANLELGNKDKALNFYEKATSVENELTAPVYLMKIGMLYETLNNSKKATEAYQTIKDKYPTSTQARQIDKYLTRARLSAKK
ncbi:hypothetical protein DMA11_00210 [Marinilabiliaceae bacterium JC017]|nr:hypothetical protein DMA11_00210 [Marinilabiliaceae bacterium JC017]